MNGQPTAENTRVCGGDGEMPGFRNWENPDHIAELARLWNVDPDAIPHWTPPTHAESSFAFFLHVIAGRILLESPLASPTDQGSRTSLTPSPRPMTITQFLGLLVVMLGAARLCGALAKAVGQPTVLGELVGGRAPRLVGPGPRRPRGRGDSSPRGAGRHPPALRHRPRDRPAEAPEGRRGLGGRRRRRRRPAVRPRVMPPAVSSGFRISSPSWPGRR